MMPNSFVLAPAHDLPVLAIDFPVVPNYFDFAPTTGDADWCLIPDETNRQWMGTLRRTSTMNEGTFRVVTQSADGQIRIRDYDTAEALLKRHSQVGVDDCSTNLNLRGLPVFHGLIGPMPKARTWSATNRPRFSRPSPRNGAHRPTRRRSRSKTTG